MAIDSGKKKFIYSKVIITNALPDQIKKGIDRKFKVFGKIERIGCDERFSHTGSHEEGNIFYDLTLIIDFERSSFAEFEKSAYLMGWEKQREIIV